MLRIRRTYKRTYPSRVVYSLGLRKRIRGWPLLLGPSCYLEAYEFGVGQRVALNQPEDRVAEQVRALTVVEPESEFMKVRLQVLPESLW